MRWRQLIQRSLHLRHAHTSTLKLRPYQETCLESCLDALKDGSSRIGVSLPTGAGKTVVFVSLLERLQDLSRNPQATRSLIIVNSVELARQAADQARKLFPHWIVEIEQGARYTASGLADVTVATYQTLLRAPRLQKFDPAGLKTVIVDEAHHAAAPSYRHILSHFNSGIKSPRAVKGAEDENDNSGVAPTTNYSVPIIGFSATFSRHDGLALGSVFDRIVYHRDFLEMIKDQWLCNVRFTCVQADINLKGVTINSATGDYNPTSLASVINTETLNSLVVQTWLDKSDNRKSTLVFCVNLSHVRELTQTFRDAGIDARYVHSKTPAAERRLLVEDFKAGEYPVLVNCAILTEGADIPNIDCVIVARPTRSRNVLAQMIGRGMRLSPGTGKEDCQIIDFVDIAGRAPGLVATPTLFGLDPSEIDDESLESLEERAREQEKESDVGFAAEDENASLEIPSPESVTYVDYDDPFAFIGECCGTIPAVQQLSPLAWVSVGGETYVLECVGAGFIRVEPSTDPEEPEVKFRVHYIPATWDKVTARTLNLSPYLRPRHVMRAQNLEQAIRGSDLYVKHSVVKGPKFLGLMRRAKWRKEPATASQKSLVESRWNKAPKYVQGEMRDDAARTLRIERLTKGEAANIIARIKHGAMSRYEYKMKAMRKEERLQLKELKRQAREVVTVGPLAN